VGKWGKNHPCRSGGKGKPMSKERMELEQSRKELAGSKDIPPLPAKKYHTKRRNTLQIGKRIKGEDVGKELTIRPEGIIPKRSEDEMQEMNPFPYQKGGTFLRVHES